jgi:gluconate 2-dehydrogenase alpha chain
MAKKLKEVDLVLVGLGWTGGILAKELSAAGLKVVALERGGMRTTENDYQVPQVRDELRYVIRHDLMQNTAKDTLTIRNNVSQEALPMRRLGSFLPGEVVGGSGVHWSGHTWRWTDQEFKVRTMYEERYGKKYIPADMTIQDWGITYAELEPYYERF